MPNEAKKALILQMTLTTLLPKNKFVTSHDMTLSQLYQILNIYDIGHVDKNLRIVSIIYQLTILYQSKVYYMLQCIVFNYFYLQLYSTVLIVNHPIIIVT